MNNSQLKATLEWAISHPFSILMWFNKQNFKTFEIKVGDFYYQILGHSFLYYHELITDLAENYRTCPPFPKSAKLSTSTLNKSKISTWRDPEVDITSLSLALRALRVTSAELAPDWPLRTGSSSSLSLKCYSNQHTLHYFVGGNWILHLDASLLIRFLLKRSLDLKHSPLLYCFWYHLFIG